MQLRLIFTLCVLPVCLKARLKWQVKRATGGSEPKLVIYSLLSQSNCSPEFELFDYKTSISNAVWYVYNKTLRSNPQFTVKLGFGEAPYCTIEQEDRAVNLTSELLLLSEQTEVLNGFAVYLGPPDGTDCNIVNDWISLSKPGSRASSRLFQINYLCRLQGFTSNFVLNDLDPATQKPVASETLAAVSLTIDLSTLISTVRVLLQTEGWEHFAIVHEVSQKQNKNAVVAQSMARTLTTENGNFELTSKRSIHPGMNLTKLMQIIPESTDVIILLTRPPLAMQFLEQNANVTRITQGRLALLHVDYTDMLTYDVLRFWRQSLQNCQPLGEPSRSLLILTALPRGTVYSENLNFFNEKTNMAASAGAGLAVRLMQLNIKNHGGRVDQNVGLFLPLVTSDVNVSINSNITFQFQQYDVNSVRGMYDIYIFSFSLEASTPTADLKNMTYTELFTLNDIIRWPIMAVQQIQPKVWPGSGRGPSKTACLLYKCQAGTFENMLSIMVGGSFLFVVTTVLLLLYRRQFRRHKKSLGKHTMLVIYASDLTFVRETKSTWRPKKRYLHTPSQSMVPSRSASFNSSVTNFGLSSNESELSSDLHTIWLNDEKVHIKWLTLPSTTFKSYMLDWIRNLRNIHNDNVNVFAGCYLDAHSLNFVYHHCSRGSLQDVIKNKRIKLDWEFKLSLLKDLIRGMQYIHKSPIKVHGRLKSRNCVIDGRWVLKITDYGVSEAYAIAGHFPETSPEDLLWMAPEQLREESRTSVGTQNGDIYSAAIIQHEMFFRTVPYGYPDMKADEIIEKVRANESLFRPKIPQNDIPVTYIELMTRGWAERPDLRPKFDEMDAYLKHWNHGKKTNIVDHMFRMMEKYSTELEHQVKLRTAQLESEKRKKEILVSRMLPPVVAESLKSGKSVIPVTYPSVSIYFSDIVGFTTISAMSTPLQVVNLLNELYTIFDDTIDAYDVYKVETIGDAYMVASGLPIPNDERHASEIAIMALDLLSHCGTFTISHLPNVPLRIRIGLHSGPCVAGVVGLTMPRYCLFGETVNTAAKMESAGAAFRIHISQPLKDILDRTGRFITEYRGTVELEGGLGITSYWLLNSADFHKPLPVPPPLNAESNHGSSSIEVVVKAPFSGHPSVCNQEEHLSSCLKKTLAFEAISDLHAQLDGDSSGGVDFSEAEKFLKDKLSSPVDPRHQKDLSQNDGIISLFDLWAAWQRNPAHNWTVQETVRWLGEGVELPQYDQVFLLHNVDGETLPRLVMRNQTFLNDYLGVKNQFHRRKLVLKTMDLILFGPPKKQSASYTELSIISACAAGVFLLSFFCLNYHYTRKMRGRDAQAADGLYAAEQTLKELQQKLKEADPLSFNGRLTSANGGEHSRLTDSGQNSDEKPIFSSGLTWRKSALRDAASVVAPGRPHLSWGSSSSGGAAAGGGILFHLPQTEEERAIQSPSQDSEEWSYKQQKQPSSLSPSSSLIDTTAATGGWTNSLRSRRHTGPRDTANTKSANAALSHNELYLWLQLTHEMELRSYWEKRAAAARQLLAAKEACDRVRRKRNSLMGSIRLVHSDNLDDVDCKLNSARHVLENVSDDLQERTIRWTRIEELTGMRLQEPVDMQWLITQLSITDENLPLTFVASRSSAGTSERPTMAPSLEYPDFADGPSDWSGSLSSRPPLDLRLVEKKLQTSSYRWPNLQQEPSCCQFARYRSAESSGRSSPDPVEAPAPQVRIPRNYSFVRPFATFWRRKTRSKYPPHGPPPMVPCSAPVGITNAPGTSAPTVATTGGSGGTSVALSSNTISDDCQWRVSNGSGKSERP